MDKLTRVLCIITMILMLAGCGTTHGINNDNDRETTEPSVEYTGADQREESTMSDMEQLNYLSEHYNIQPEDVEGLDLTRMFEDYGFAESDYTEEAVRRIIRTQGKYYVDDGSTKLMSIFKAEGTSEYSGKEQVVRVGYQSTVGNRPFVYIFHLDEKKAFNFTEEQGISDEQIQKLLTLLDEAEVSSWDHYYEGEEQSSTGSLSWKLVLILENGSSCVYGGYTGDGSHLPAEFDTLVTGLDTLMEELYSE